MNFVRATCPTCGDIRLPSSQFTIRTCIGQPIGEYRWNCECGIVVKQADETIISILRSSGVKEEVWELPLELMEHPVDGELREDAIIDLQLAFEDGSVFDKITKKYR